MDRNLGASQVATAFDDELAYGDLYQWGRLTDGHEKRTSSMVGDQSIGDVPGHGYFINGSQDWRSTQNDNLWQGVTGINNPCPSGFRVPTYTEWDTERLSWSSNDRDGAFDSPLKLVAAGFRNFGTGDVTGAGFVGRYWSSTIHTASAWYLGNDDSNAFMSTAFRSWGRDVRCIKD